MGHFHSFVTDDNTNFILQLKARGYAAQSFQAGDKWTQFGKTLSEAVDKYYSLPVNQAEHTPAEVRVTYRMLLAGKPLKKIAARLKQLNTHYREALPIWKTKVPLPESVRKERWQSIQRFVKEHEELIRCYRYEGDAYGAEGNASFNLEVGSTTRERGVCFEFIKALLEAFTPLGVVRGQRQADKPKLQRDGWIKRYASLHKRRGWRTREILSEIQKELRDGTWNDRNRLRYNLALNTIGRIAGLKTASPGSLQYH